MSLKPNYHGSHLKASLTPNRNLAIFRKIAFQVRECRGPRRRRLKSNRNSELLEDVNERLVKEERHFVRLNSGRIQERGGDERDEAREENIVYQRECVSTEDGGVISLDWPANLDFTEERGLDTTLLIIPGTAEGSMDKNIRSFVCESLMRGYFPVVVNPRGCAGSPLTTAR
ncbi:alpha/beta-Hydrolases superfamily protein [Actinidia rufa]|uniref:Alpha/beta-Hydrolases superfamily protein n=1 Tax=Actinidia rufa TaxID=165716 RepID=A0A7J0FIR6_9ERIC|nr:alpha/beta-Hydrolases superfamily protein [Actinidia rufa]